MGRRCKYEMSKFNLTASVSGGCWSYVTNQNGNSMRITLEGYGSCTPLDVLQAFLDRLDEGERKSWSDDCDEMKVPFD